MARFVSDVAAVAEPETLAADVAALVAAASDDHGGRGLSGRELARAIRFAAQLTKPARDLERDEQRRRLGRALHKSAGPARMSSYRVLLDAEGAAVLDAALAGLRHRSRGPTGSGNPARRRPDEPTRCSRWSAAGSPARASSRGPTRRRSSSPSRWLTCSRRAAAPG